MTRFQRLRLRLRLHWYHVPTYEVVWYHGQRDVQCWCGRYLETP